MKWFGCWMLMVWLDLLWGATLTQSGCYSACVSRPPNLFLYSNPWPDWHRHCACVQNTSILDTLATGSNAMQDYYLFLSIIKLNIRDLYACSIIKKEKEKRAFCLCVVAGGLGRGGCLTLEYKQHEKKKTQIKSENKRKNPGPRMHRCGTSQTIYA